MDTAVTGPARVRPDGGHGGHDGADGPGGPARGYLVVRASGAAAAAAAMGGAVAPASVQVLMQVPRALPATTLDAGDASLRAEGGVVMLTVAAARLTIGFDELRPLMFRPVETEPALRALFGGAAAAVLAAGPALDRHGLAHHLVGLAELVLRSALRAELNRVDTLAARRREALDFIRANLADPELGADQVAAALFVSRRRLYQLFDDGQGVAERIRGLRVEHAKGLLADPARGALGIAEVAGECGFVSAAHFSRTFRKEVGETPREYRERSRRP
ncbi:MAG TPA: AraC family transcriptional regulator [Pseudonocardiaceae bacterium]